MGTMDNLTGFSGRMDVKGSQKFGLEKLLGLLTDEDTRLMYDRHALTLERICRNNEGGFWVGDLPKVRQVLELGLLLVKKGRLEFVQPLCNLLRVLSIPFQCRTSTDELRMVAHVADLLSCTASIFSEDFPFVLWISAGKMLHTFASSGEQSTALLSSKELDDPLSVSRQFHTNQQLISRGSVIPSVISGLNIALQSSNKDIVSCLIDLIFDLSYTTESCDQMVENGLLQLAPTLLKGYTEPSQLVGLLWNVLENKSQDIYMEASSVVMRLEISPEGDIRAELVEEKLSNQLARALMGIWSNCLRHGFRTADKELRNEVLIIIMLLSKDPDFQAELLCMQFIELALKALAFIYGLEHTEKFQSIAVTDQDLNFELACLIITGVTSLCSSQECLKEATSKGLIKLLLEPADACSSFLSHCSWKSKQQGWILRQSLHCLSSLAPASGQILITDGGIDVIRECVSSPLTQDLLQIAVSIVTHSAQKDASLGEAFGSSGIIVPLVDIYGNDSNNWETRSTASLAITALCSGNTMNQQRFSDANGLSIVIAQLVNAKGRDPTISSSLLVGACDLIWRAIIPHEGLLDRFLVAGGLDGILDLLDTGHVWHRAVLLSLLPDVLENTKSHSIFHEWQSGVSGKSAAQVLLEIWREQEDTMGISDCGVLVNAARPLAGTGKRKKWDAKNTIAYGTLCEQRRTDVQMLESTVDPNQIMTKLYGVFSLVGFKSFAHLDPRDRATLALIGKYIELRQGEIWQDIKSNLGEAGIKPIAADRERLHSGIASAENIAMEVQEAQRDLMLSHMRDLHQKELQTYTNTLLQKKADAEARFFQKDRSQLTMKERLEAKLKKEEMLKNSIKAAQSEYCNAEYSRQERASTTDEI